MEVISRTDAHAAGRKYFYTAASCKRGHDGPRFVSNGACKICHAQNMRKYQNRFSQNPEFVDVAVKVHPGDVAEIKALAASLAALRQYEGPSKPHMRILRVLVHKDDEAIVSQTVAALNSKYES